MTLISKEYIFNRPIIKSIESRHLSAFSCWHLIKVHKFHFFPAAFANGNSIFASLSKPSLHRLIYPHQQFDLFPIFTIFLDRISSNALKAYTSSSCYFLFRQTAFVTAVNNICRCTVHTMCASSTPSTPPPRVYNNTLLKTYARGPALSSLQTRTVSSRD